MGILNLIGTVGGFIVGGAGGGIGAGIYACRHSTAINQNVAVMEVIAHSIGGAVAGGLALSCIVAALL